MGAQSIVATIPAQLVRAPSGFGLYFRISVTGAASLPSLLPNGVLPTIPPANTTGPGGQVYAFKFVDLQCETDPNGGGAYVRYTDDGQTTPTATLGFVVPGQPSFIRIPADPQDIKLISSTGGAVAVQVKLGIMGLTTGSN